MSMSGTYGPADEDESVATIHEALERGINLLDTGDFYGMGHNEMLLGRALKGRRDKALISVKYGVLRGPDGSWLGIDCSPTSTKSALAYTLKRLGVDHIDIYRPARLDPRVPIEDTIGTIADLIKAGYVRAIGLSEVSADTIRRAQAVHPICDLQIEYSLISRSPEQTIFPVLTDWGVGVTAYGVLSRGLLAGSKPSAEGDFRAHLPRFKEENFHRNARLVAALREIAEEKGRSSTELAIAWVLNKGPHIIPLIGARTRVQLRESVAALELELSNDEIARIEQAIPEGSAAGTRYDVHQMRMLDSERPPNS